MKNVLRLSALLIMASVAMVQARSVDPQFVTEGGREFIKLVSQGWLCGSVKIVPKAEGIKLISTRSWEKTFSSDRDDETIGSKELVYPTGLTVNFDWAGGKPSYEYRIYVEKKDSKGNYQAIPASQGVSLENISNNNPCGPSLPGTYADLNMNKG